MFSIRVIAIALRMTCVSNYMLQAHGGMGVCQDTVLPALYAGIRTLRIADGPDEVHMRAISRMEVRTRNQAKL